MDILLAHLELGKNFDPVCPNSSSGELFPGIGCDSPQRVEPNDRQDRRNAAGIPHLFVRLERNDSARVLPDLGRWQPGRCPNGSGPGLVRPKPVATGLVRSKKSWPTDP